MGAQWGFRGRWAQSVHPFSQLSIVPFSNSVMSALANHSSYWRKNRREKIELR